MIKAEHWEGHNLHGVWHFTIKIDGVRAISDGTTVCSKRGKPLYGLDHLASAFEDAEIFCGSFKETITVVRSHNERPVKLEEVYPLIPLDPRLGLATVNSPSTKFILDAMNRAIALGHEGLVLRQGDT